jgi:hypothetical protein
MDHGEAIRQKATERYLLNELDSAARDEFEEHLFDCQDCALDLRAASSFVERSKVLLAEETTAVAPVRERVVVAEKQPSWMAWFKPAFAMPVFAALLLVIGYMGVTNHRLDEALNSPHLLSSVMVNVSTRGDVSRIVVPKDQPFLLNMRIPLENGTLQYEADFSDPQNKLQWAVSIAAIPGEDMYTVQMPAGLESGRYTLKIQSIEPSGQKKEVGIEAPFDVQIER